MTSLSRPFKTAAYGQVALVGKALASPARLELLELLAQSPCTVEVLARQIDQSVANTSHHLKSLKHAHLVRTERQGLHVQYSLAGPDVAMLLSSLQSVAQRHLAELARLSRDFFGPDSALEPVPHDDLLARLTSGEAILVDVRPAKEFEAGHLPGAISVPLDALADHLAQLPTDRTLVAYCRGPFCTFSADAVRQLRASGFDARRADISVHSADSALSAAAGV
ncbi:MAG: metalloregulator ArsR/SmtB family transcription factor [Myxococcales bacterium]|nr:metalloregulator ArsR/SmtB family transcription factor [Myxococcales bacterium]